MISMAKEKEDRTKDRHKNKPLQLRLHNLLRQQLELMAKENLSTMTAEATVAIRKHLEAAGYWPPKSPEKK